MNKFNLQATCDALQSIKNILQTIATNYKKKNKGFHRVLASYETKSNNLAFLKDDVMAALHDLIAAFDRCCQLGIECLATYTGEQG